MLKRIQQKFHKEFPWLKLEFFKTPHGKAEASAKKDLLDKSLTVAEIAKGKGEIAITEKSKVSAVEQEFQKKIGLSVQVFRKSGNVWLETSRTDDLTLEQQQQAAKESETHYQYSMHNFADERQ